MKRIPIFILFVCFIFASCSPKDATPNVENHTTTPENPDQPTTPENPDHSTMTNHKSYAITSKSAFWAKTHSTLKNTFKNTTPDNPEQPEIAKSEFRDKTHSTLKNTFNHFAEKYKDAAPMILAFSKSIDWIPKVDSKKVATSIQEFFAQINDSLDEGDAILLSLFKDAQVSIEDNKVRLSLDKLIGSDLPAFSHLYLDITPGKQLLLATLVIAMAGHETPLVEFKAGEHRLTTSFLPGLSPFLENMDEKDRTSPTVVQWINFKSTISFDDAASQDCADPTARFCLALDFDSIKHDESKSTYYIEKGSEPKNALYLGLDDKATLIAGANINKFNTNNGRSQKALKRVDLEQPVSFHARWNGRDIQINSFVADLVLKGKYAFKIQTTPSVPNEPFTIRLGEQELMSLNRENIEEVLKKAHTSPVMGNSNGLLKTFGGSLKIDVQGKTLIEMKDSEVLNK